MDERAYEKALRRIVLVPLMTRLRDGLSQAAAASMALDVINRITWDRGLMERLVEAEVAAHSARLSGYHKARLIQTFKAALAIDIRPQLSDSAIQPLMDAWRRENIGLIRTIPQRFHESLYQRVSETFTERPFDQQALSKVLNREYRTAGYNLRRLTRDQTSKAIGQLTQTRHQQLGITEYKWRTAQDERVRDTHAALDGTPQRWDTPPGVGHPGEAIQCRCVAIPIVDKTTPTTGSAHQAKGEAFYSRDGRPNLTVPAYPRAMHRRDPEFRQSADLRPGTRAYIATKTHGPGFESLNSAMRVGQELNAQHHRMLREMYADARPLKTDRIVYRGLRAKLDASPGDVLRLHPPTSTSMSYSYVERKYAGQTLIQARVPKDTMAIVTNEPEREVIFMPGRTLHVTQRTTDVRGRIVLIGELR